MGFLGGHFDGEMTSEGSGARVRAGVRDIPLIGDVDLVNVHVPGFKRGGVIGKGPSAAQAAEASARAQGRTVLPPAPRGQGGQNSPTGGRGFAGTDPTAPSGHVHHGQGGARPAHGIGAGLVLSPGVGMAGRGGAGVRRRHEVAPGVPCPSCAAGITKPVR